MRTDPHRRRGLNYCREIAKCCSGSSDRHYWRPLKALSRVLHAFCLVPTFSNRFTYIPTCLKHALNLHIAHFFSFFSRFFFDFFQKIIKNFDKNRLNVLKNSENSIKFNIILKKPLKMGKKFLPGW